MHKISIVITTWGENKWSALAQNRAYPAAAVQNADEILLHHEAAGNAATARNAAIEKAQYPWIICCDADDQLELGYAAAMRESAGDLRYPMVRLIPPSFTIESPVPYPEAVEIPRINIRSGNYMVIGTMFRKDMFLRVGGFRDLPIWEDWDLFMRMIYSGAIPRLCRRAIYRIFVNPNGRNKHPANPAVVSQKILSDFQYWAMKYDGGRRMRSFGL